MRIVITDYQHVRTCDSEDTDIIALWLTDQCRRLMTVNASLPPAQLEVWASNRREEGLISAFQSAKITNLVDGEGLLRLGAAILRLGHEAMAANATRRT